MGEQEDRSAEIYGEGRQQPVRVVYVREEQSAARTTVLVLLLLAVIVLAMFHIKYRDAYGPIDLLARSPVSEQQIVDAIYRDAVEAGVRDAFRGAKRDSRVTLVEKVSDCLDLHRVRHRAYPDSLTALSPACVSDDLSGLDYVQISARRFDLCDGDAGYCSHR